MNYKAVSVLFIHHLLINVRSQKFPCKMYIQHEQPEKV